MTADELNAIRYLTIGLAKETLKQDWENFGKEDDDYIREKLVLDNYCKGVEDVLKILGNMKQESKWVPVTEGPPKKDGLYLVSVKNDHLRKYSKTCWYSNKNWFARQDVVAWQPLPEPYKAENEEDNRND